MRCFVPIYQGALFLSLACLPDQICAGYSVFVLEENCAFRCETFLGSQEQVQPRPVVDAARN